MYYRSELKDYIRVPPHFFSEDVESAVLKSIKQKYEGFIDPEFGIVIDVTNITDVKSGIIIPGDGASYYETIFEVLVFKPELQEVVIGKIKDIADFGAFLTLGPIEGMIHISQTMDDFVSFSKEKVLVGKESGRVLKVGDKCRAKMIAVSFKDPSNPKLGLTMRQHCLGKLEWLDEPTTTLTQTKKEKTKRPVSGK
ncbi:MAG: DNA-directed RNA polymerase [Nanoarchaeota archaeon]